MVYPDLECVLALLNNGEHSEETAALLREESPRPLTISVVHRLQVENALLRFLYHSDGEVQRNARNGLLMWQHYLREEVFVSRELDISAAFVQSAAWNAEYQVQPPRWHALIHVGIAANLNAAFMSFEPALRKKASDIGLSLRPATL
jgi:hypothetical protein